MYKNVSIIDIYIFSGYGDVREDYEEVRKKLNSTKHIVFQIDTSLPVHKCIQCNSKLGASLSTSHVAFWSHCFWFEFPAVLQGMPLLCPFRLSGK